VYRTAFKVVIALCDGCTSRVIAKPPPHARTASRHVPSPLGPLQAAHIRSSLAMNISQPVGTLLDSVDFTFLSAEEIRGLSVRKLDNETTFDSLLNPVPGGLYDPALGAWGDVV
jgi:hypothetical protein